MNNLLYIGLNGYAGSGKDTVAKMLYCILNKDWTSKEECWEEFRTKHATNIKPYATLSTNFIDGIKDYHCTCIAFADRLKSVCSTMFGIPVEYFYYNKNNSWICINKDFEYTESRPREELIVTAEDYYSCRDSYMHSSNRYYMSLREILVYIGTYICQWSICNNVFVNSVKNKVEALQYEMPDLNYVICTDVRFTHEYDFIKANNGIMININRDGVEQAEDIAEHDLDMMDKDNYNYIIYNNGSYEDLFNSVWEMTHTSIEFSNKIIPLKGRVHDTNTYLRKIKEDNEKRVRVYKLCSSNGISKVQHSEGKIVSIDPEGGPQIYLLQRINEDTVTRIIFNDSTAEYFIFTEF